MRNVLSGLFLTCISGCSPRAELPVLREGSAEAITLVGDQGTAAIEFTAPPELGELFAVEGRLVLDHGTSDIQFLRLDAGMPGHGHGMLTEPVTRTLDAGEFRAEGFKLHMFGEWRLTLDVRTSDGESLRLERTFLFEPREVDSRGL